MTDQFFDAHKSGGGTHTRPIQAGYVPVNLRLDQAELDNRLLEGTETTLWPSATLSAVKFWVLPHDVLLAKKRTHLPSGADGIVPVFSSLAGLGRGGLTKAEVEESLTFAGVAGGFSIEYDNSGRAKRWPDLAGKIGGMDMLTNTSNKRWKNGDKLYWRLPDPGDVPPQMRRKDGRILAEICPYNPKDQTVTARGVCEKLRTPGGVTTLMKADMQTPLGEAAVGIRDFAAFMATASFQMFLAAGLFAFDPDALDISPDGEAKRAQNAAAWGALASSRREDAIVRVGQALRVRGLRDATRMSKVTMPLERGNVFMSAYLSALITCDREVVAPSATHALPPGAKGALLGAQRSALEGLLAATASANDHVLSRVFATALTPAAPGEEADVVIGKSVS